MPAIKYNTLERINRKTGMPEEVTIYLWKKITPIPMFARVYRSNGEMVDLNYLDTNGVKMPSKEYTLVSPKIKDDIYWVLPNSKFDLRLEFVDISNNRIVNKVNVLADSKMARWKNWEDVTGGIAIDLNQFPDGAYFVYWYDNEADELLRVDIVRRGCN